MNRRFLLALAASALFGLVAILIFQKILTNRLSQVSEQGQQKIVYAATKIPVGTLITQGQIKPVLHEAKSLPEGAIQDINEVIGKIAQVDLDSNMPILAKTIASEKNSQRLWPETGMRAMAIRVDEASSVAGFATPGSRVDVVAVLTPSANSKPVAKVIVQDLRVLANGQQTQVKAEAQGRIGNTVTLEVSPAQSGILTLAQREGSLQLILRHPGDRILTQTQPVLTKYFVDEIPDNSRKPASASERPTSLGGLPTPAPVTPIAPTPTATPRMFVRVISNDKVETVSVRQ